MPLLAVLSSSRLAWRTNSAATVPSPEPMAVRAFRTAVLHADVPAEFRSRRCRERMISFFDDLMLAKDEPPVYGDDYSIETQAFTSPFRRASEA